MRTRPPPAPDGGIAVPRLLARPAAQRCRSRPDPGRSAAGDGRRLRPSSWRPPEPTAGNLFADVPGAFGTWFSWQNTLQRTAPLLLTALWRCRPSSASSSSAARSACDRRPVSAAVGAALIGAPPWLLLSLMALAGMAAAERDRAGRGAAAVPRRQRDDLQPAAGLYRDRPDEPHGRRTVARSASLNKPSTPPLGDANMLGSIPDWMSIGGWCSA